MKNFIKKLKLIWFIFFKLKPNEVFDWNLPFWCAILKNGLPSKSDASKITCVLKGHEWDHEFDPAKAESKTIKERTYCKVCGVKYHKPNYKK